MQELTIANRHETVLNRCRLDANLTVNIIADVLLSCCGPASESTNRRLIIYTVVEYVCLVGVSFGQVYLIRKLFDKRLGYNRV